MTAWLLRLMGLEAIDQTPHLRQRGGGQQVWRTESTDLRLLPGCVDVVASRDWFSRDVVAWAVSVTLARDFCLSALERGLVPAQPAIFNSAQGAQFPRAAFTERLKAGGIPIRRDGRGRARANIFVER
jgi:putative transposase